MNEWINEWMRKILDLMLDIPPASMTIAFVQTLTTYSIIVFQLRAFHVGSTTSKIIFPIHKTVILISLGNLHHHILGSNSLIPSLYSGRTCLFAWQNAPRTPTWCYVLPKPQLSCPSALVHVIFLCHLPHRSSLHVLTFLFLSSIRPLHKHLLTTYYLTRIVPSTELTIYLYRLTYDN